MDGVDQVVKLELLSGLVRAVTGVSLGCHAVLCQVEQQDSAIKPQLLWFLLPPCLISSSPVPPCCVTSI